MTTETLLWLVPLPPVLAFFLIVLFTHRRKGLSHGIAIGAALLSWLGSMVIIFRAIQVEHLGRHPFETSIPWLPTGDTWLRIGMLVDPLTAVTLFFVGWTVLMIFIYSVDYHNYKQPKGDHDRPGLPPHGAGRDGYPRPQAQRAVGRADVLALLCVHRAVCCGDVPAGAFG